MMKSLFTKTGDIKYIELFKITILISLLFGLFSRFTTNNSDALIGTNSVVYSALMILVVTQFIIGIIADHQELFELLKSFVLRVIELPKMEFKMVRKCQFNFLIGFVPSNNRYLKLNVIRC